MVALADFLKLDEDECEGKFPFIWAVDQKNRLTRLLVAEDLVRASEERLGYWHQLKDIASAGGAGAASGDVVEQVRAELLAKISASLGMAGAPMVSDASAPVAAAAAGGFDAAWIESPECTACDECINIAPKVFAYNDQKQAIVINPQGAKFADIVKAAEKCTAGCIHPGTPWNASEPGLDKLKARAAKFN